MPDKPPLIAVLDDEVRMRAALSRLLRSSGYEIVPGEDSAALQAALATPPVTSSVLDLHMPAPTALIRSNCSRPTTPIRRCSSSPGALNPVMKSVSRGSEASAWLVESVHETPLFQAVESALKRS